MSLDVWEDRLETEDGGGIPGIIQRTLDMVDPRLMRHGARVAQLLFRLLKKQGEYDDKEIYKICFIGLLHDIGAYKTEEIDRMIQFETGEIWNHSIYGNLFIKYFSPLNDYAELVLFHHVSWKKLSQIEGLSRKTAELIQLLNLADRADLYFEQKNRTTEDFAAALRKAGEDRFLGSAAELLLSVGDIREILSEDPFAEGMIFYRDDHLTLLEKSSILKMLVFAIDFRSFYTVTHTMVTAGISWETAKRLKLTKEEQVQVAFGAMLHDLGKIGIPIEILEFPGPLSTEKMEIMRTHVDLTEQIIGPAVKEPVKRIALRHHEKLDGKGYPRGLHAEELTLAERIVAVADIVSALNGKRSYKDSFSKEKTVKIIGTMGAQGLLDSTVTDLIIEQFDDIMAVVTELCDPVTEAYNRVGKEYKELLERYGSL